MKISWEKIRKSWAYRTIAVIGKTFLVFVMICYVYIGAASVITLLRKDHVRKQDISFLPTVIKRSVDARKPEAVTEWVRFRPQEETPALIALITPKSGELGPDIFFEFYRRELQQKNMEEALFWLQLARFRLRYDTLRCSTGGQTEFLNKILRMTSSAQIESLLQEKPYLVKKSIRKVMDFDVRHPAVNNPSFICGMMGKIGQGVTSPLPKEQWQALRAGLRKSTEQALKKMDGKHPE